MAKEYSASKIKHKNRLQYHQIKEMAKLSLANILSIVVTLTMYTGAVNRFGLGGFAYINLLVTGLVFSAGLAGFGLPEYLQKSASNNASNVVKVALGGLFSVTPIIALIAYTHNIAGRRIDAVEAAAILVAIPSIIINESGSRVLLQLGKTNVASIVNLVPNILFWLFINISPKDTALSNVILFYSLVNGCFAMFLLPLVKTRIPTIKFSWLLFHGGSICLSACGLRLIVTGFDFLPLLMLQFAKIGCLAGAYSFLGRFFFPIILLLNVSSAVLQKSNFSNLDHGSSFLRQVIITSAVFIGSVIAITATIAYMVLGDQLVQNDTCKKELIKFDDLLGLMLYRVAYIVCKFLLESKLNNLLVARIQIAVLASLILWLAIIWLSKLGDPVSVSASIWGMTISVVLVNFIIVARNRTRV